MLLQRKEGAQQRERVIIGKYGWCQEACCIVLASDVRGVLEEDLFGRESSEKIWGLERKKIYGWPRKKLIIPRGGSATAIKRKD